MPGSNAKPEGPEPAVDRLGAIVRQCRSGDPVVFLDYDGTLTPIVRSPELARLPDAMRDTLTTLASTVPVGIVSGRALDNIREMVGLDALYYAGNHGLEVVGPRGSDVHAVRGEEFLEDTVAAGQRLKESLRGFSGVLIEDKRLTLSIHYRQADDEKVPEIERIIDGVLQDYPRLRKHGGKKVYEVRPGIEWDKGRVVQWLIDLLHLPNPVPIYIGDDVTDEDAFRAIAGDGIGIRVGNDAKETAARYLLRDTDEVMLFLRNLAQKLAGAERW